MASLLKNVASQNICFGMVNATTGAADTGATVTVYVTKDNGTQATGTGTVTTKGQGQYNYAPTQAETNAADVGFAFTATGDVPVFFDFHTDISTSAGYVGIDWASINAPTTTQGLTGTTISTSQAVASVSGAVGSVTGNVGGSVASVTGNVGGVTGVTFPSTVASPTNITAGTITTVTNLTNAPTAGDFTTTMKTSLNAATPASVTTVTGNVNGSVGSVIGAVTVSGASPLTESYAAAGAALTLAQALYSINQQIGQQSITGTTKTVQKRDGVTTANTYTLNSATAPSAITQTS